MTHPVDWLRMAELCLDMADVAPELDRLRYIGAGMDGYGRGGAQRGGTGTSDPTSALAVNLAGGKLEGDVVKGERIEVATPDTWRVPNDGIGILLAKLAEQSRQMGDCARRIAGIKRLIMGRADDRVGRQSSLVDCLACESGVSGVGVDRIKTGYCPRCWTAWLRYRTSETQVGRSADHELFRRRQRRDIAKARAS